MVNKAEMIRKIADLINEKKIEGISYINDESDRNGMRIVIILKKDATANVVLNTAFGHPTIAVDTHIFRVSNRTGIAPGKNVNEVEQRLLRLVPREFLHDAHHWLILLGRYTCTARKPRCGACLIEDAQAGDRRLLEVASGDSSSGLGRGGMVTKVRAAELAARSGAATWIGPGREAQILRRMAAGDPLGTVVHPASGRLVSRKQWLAGQLQARGRLNLDQGAVRVLQESGRSLLAVGVTAVEGTFRRGEVVSCHGPDGAAIARGLVNYSAEEARKIMGQPSERIAQLLGYVDEPELIHRDNLVLL